MFCNYSSDPINASLMIAKYRFCLFKFRETLRLRCLPPQLRMNYYAVISEMSLVVTLNFIAL
jgi:hypothetical protein